jgi:hypothetical protein
VAKMSNLTTKLDLTSTTIQIRSDDAKSNFMNFEHKWEAVNCIEVKASVTKSEKFDLVYKTLTAYEKEYVNLVCNNTKFGEIRKYYLPDWVFLEVDGETMSESITNVIIEVVTGVNPVNTPGLFVATIDSINLDVDAELGFPVLD